MSNLIVYASTQGFTRRYAEALAAQLTGDTTLMDLARDPQPDCSRFDTVVIGTAIYYGQPIKLVRDFCSANLAQLQTKRLGLFVCNMQLEQGQSFVEAAFPAELRSVAVAAFALPGGLVMSRLNGMQRLVARVIAHAAQDVSWYDEDKVVNFAAVLNAASPM